MSNEESLSESRNKTFKPFPEIKVRDRQVKEPFN